MLNTLITLIFFQAGLFVDSNPEPLYAHLSQPYYTGGDILWTKVYFLNTDTSDIQSNVIHVDLLDPSGNLLHEERIRRKANYGEWSYQLPFDLPGGVYTIRFYTLWNLNFDPPVSYQRSFELLSGAGKGSAPPDHRDWEQHSMVVGNSPLQLSLKSDKETYQKGEKIRVYIEASDSFGEAVSGNFSVAVSDAAWISPADASRAHLQEQLNRLENAAPNFQRRLQAEKGLRVEGMAYSPETKMPLETNYLSLHLVEENEYHQINTEGGQFKFDVPAFYGKQNAQIHNLNPYQDPLPEIEILHPATLLPQDSKSLLEATAPDSLARNRYLFLMRQQRKYREIFGQAPTPVRQRPDRQIARGEADLSFDMDDFHQLISVDEFLDEVVLTARLKGSNEDRRIFLQESETYKRYSRPAWFQVDGFLISDTPYALAIPFGSVDSIQVFSSRDKIAAHFPSIMAAFGVVGIKTKDGKLPEGLEDVSNGFEVSGFHFPYTFSPPPTGNAPDFRPLVHWESQIQTDETGRAWIEFPASDALGTFIIQAEGVSLDGRAGAATLKYIVE